MTDLFSYSAASEDNMRPLVLISALYHRCDHLELLVRMEMMQ
jgi:hypothetical protein